VPPFPDTLYVLLRLHREMAAVDCLQVWITTAKESGPHNCPEKEKENKENNGKIKKIKENLCTNSQRYIK